MILSAPLGNKTRCVAPPDHKKKEAIFRMTCCYNLKKGKHHTNNGYIFRSKNQESKLVGKVSVRVMVNNLGIRLVKASRQVSLSQGQTHSIGNTLSKRPYTTNKNLLLEHSLSIVFKISIHTPACRPVVYDTHFHMEKDITT
jgi:hypothetical protein